MDKKFNDISYILERQNYNKKYDVLVDNDESFFLYEMIKTDYREFEPAWKSWLMGGLSGAASYYGGKKYADVKGKGTIGKALAGLLSIPIGMFLAHQYRKKTDRCKNYCGNDKLCFYKCYVDACDDAINRIKNDLNIIIKIKDIEDKAKLHKKLIKQLKFYGKKKEYYIKKVKETEDKLTIKKYDFKFRNI